MKLHEEFKLYEDMWEDEVPAADEAIAEETANISDPLIRTFGRKTYNLANPDELDAWFKANFEFQQKRYPGTYRDNDGTINSRWLRLRSHIARNLLISLQSEGVDNPDVIDRLKRIMGTGSKLSKAFTDDELDALFSDFAISLSARFDSREMRIVTKDLDKLKQKLKNIRSV